MKFSHLLHYIRYLGPEPRKAIGKLGTGMLITSIDVDVVSSKVASLNRGRNDANVNDRLTEYQVGAAEEMALPLFVDLFDRFQMPVTFAIRGQALELGESPLAPILEAQVKHDIGVHGYSHKSFQGLSQKEAEEELNMTEVLINKMGFAPKSFVFPRNKVAYLNLLRKHKYQCYRDFGDILHDGMYIRKCNQLYDIHPGLYLSQGASYALLKRILDLSISRRLPLHVWFHLWRFGLDEKSIRKSINTIFRPFIGYARQKVDEGELSFETMLSSINGLKRVRET
jgi:hypothetical protein